MDAELIVPPVTRAYEEVIDFIAAESPDKVVAFRPSEASRARVAELVDRGKDSRLTCSGASGGELNRPARPRG